MYLKVVPRRSGPLQPAAWGFLWVPPSESEFLRVGPDNPHFKGTLQVLQGPKPSSALATTKGTLPQFPSPALATTFLLPPRNSPPPIPSLPWIFFFGSLSNSEVGYHSPFLPPVLAGGKESLGGGGGGHKHVVFVLPGRPEGLESQVVTSNQSQSNCQATDL